MNRTEFASVVPKVKVWESKLLSKSFYDKIIDTISLEESLKILQETPYGAYIEEGNIENSLKESFVRECKEINSMPQCGDIMKFISLKYDYHNIKTLIKSEILNKDFSYILSPLGTIKEEELSEKIKNNNLSDLDEKFKLAIENGFALYESCKDFQEVDIFLDKYMFVHMNEFVKNINTQFVYDYFKSLIDVTNIKTVLRLVKMDKEKSYLKKVLIENGRIELSIFESILTDGIESASSRLSHTKYSDLMKEKITSLSSFEKLVDDYITSIMKSAKLIGLGMEPIFAYLYAKEMELKNLRIILAGKLNNVDADIIKERLRDSYV